MFADGVVTCFGCAEQVSTTATGTRTSRLPAPSPYEVERAAASGSDAYLLLDAGSDSEPLVARITEAGAQVWQVGIVGDDEQTIVAAPEGVYVHSATATTLLDTNNGSVTWFAQGSLWPDGAGGVIALDEVAQTVTSLDASLTPRWTATFAAIPEPDTQPFEFDDPVIAPDGVWIHGLSPGQLTVNGRVIGTQFVFFVELDSNGSVERSFELPFQDLGPNVGPAALVGDQFVIALHNDGTRLLDVVDFEGHDHPIPYSLEDTTFLTLDPPIAAPDGTVWLGVSAELDEDGSLGFTIGSRTFHDSRDILNVVL